MTRTWKNTEEVGTEAALFKIRRELNPCPVVATFTVDGEPISKARARFTKRGNKTVAYTPEKTKAGEQMMAWKFRAAAKGWKVNDTDYFGVTALFFNETRQRRDVDNMVKLILDGLNGICWKDDNQVTEISARKMFRTPKGQARTEVMVYWLGPSEHDKLTKPCKFCGKEFETWPSLIEKAVYCSPECRTAHRIERRKTNCINCGEEFLAPGETKIADRKFCSRECQSDYGRVRINCAICDAEFETVRSWAKDRNYCSDECRREQDRRVHKERRSKHFPGTCLVCGAGTTRKEYRRCNPCKRAGKAIPDPQNQPTII